MTRTHLASHAEFLHFIDMSNDFTQQYEAYLRKLKGEEYRRDAEIVGVSFDRPGRDEGKAIQRDDLDMEEYVVSIGVKTDDGRQIMTEIPTPEMWDLTNKLVVVLEYLDLEPEELHTVGNGSRTLPVVFDTEEMTYRLNFSSMRDSIIDSNDS